MKRIWLRDARLKAKLSQADLAARVGKRQNYISKLETGVIEPRWSDVLALAKALSVAPERLRFDHSEALAS